MKKILIISLISLIYPSICTNDIDSLNWCFNLSSIQGFYGFNNIDINGEGIESGSVVGHNEGVWQCPEGNCDVIAAFYNDICIGWTYPFYNNIYTIPVMMNDGYSIDFENYPIIGDIPEFKLYDVSDNTIYSTSTIPSIPPIYNNCFEILDTLTTSISGCTHLDALNYNFDANINDGSCLFDVCGNSNACDYDERCQIDGEYGSFGICNGVCDHFPEEFYDCDGNCIVFDCSGDCGDNDYSCYIPYDLSYEILDNNNLELTWDRRIYNYNGSYCHESSGWCYDISTFQVFYMFETVSINGEIANWTNGTCYDDALEPGTECNENTDCPFACDDLNGDGDTDDTVGGISECVSEQGACILNEEDQRDVIGAFCQDYIEEETLVGWTYAAESYTTVPAMGFDGANAGCYPGEVPEFKIYDVSENIIYNANSNLEIPGWNQGEICILDTLSSSGIMINHPLEFNIYKNGSLIQNINELTYFENNLINDFEYNYQISSIINDVETQLSESIVFVLPLGCTDQNACNYNELANTDDGSCEYPPAYPNNIFDCNGNCLVDIDCLNICGGEDFSCYGCTDYLANNYEEEKTIDDGSCMYTYINNLNAGVNMISFWTLPENNSLENVMNSLGFAVNGVIGEGIAATRLETGEWVGNLQTIEYTSGYRVKTDYESTLFFDNGLRIGNIEYDLHIGNNLISYPFPGSMSISESIPDEVEIYFSGIIGEAVAASQNEPFNLVGSLNLLEGGDGYWANLTEPILFYFIVPDSVLIQNSGYYDLKK